MSSVIIENRGAAASGGVLSNGTLHGRVNRPSDEVASTPMREIEIPAGALVHVDGVPLELCGRTRVSGKPADVARLDRRKLPFFADRVGVDEQASPQG